MSRQKYLTDALNDAINGKNNHYYKTSKFYTKDDYEKMQELNLALN